MRQRLLATFSNTLPVIMSMSFDFHSVKSLSCEVLATLEILGMVRRSHGASAADKMKGEVLEAIPQLNRAPNVASAATFARGA